MTVCLEQKREPSSVLTHGAEGPVGTRSALPDRKAQEAFFLAFFFPPEFYYHIRVSPAVARSPSLEDSGQQRWQSLGVTNSLLPLRSRVQQTLIGDTGLDGI